MTMPSVVFYYKDECHLCEELNTQLNPLKEKYSFDVIYRDIESNEKWYEEYREYVPVLVVNNEEVCHYFLDQDELLDALNITY